MNKVIVISLMLPFIFVCCYRRNLSPEEVLIHFAEAIEDKDYKLAYELMDEEYKGRVSYKEFTKEIEENHEEIKSFVKLLKYPPEVVEKYIIIKYGTGDELRLVLEDNQWKVDSNIINFYDQSSPKKAIYSFIKAIKNRRYDILLRFIPNEQKENITPEVLKDKWYKEEKEEIDQFITRFIANREVSVEIYDRRATIRYYKNHEVHLIFEDGVWKIESWN